MTLNEFFLALLILVSFVAIRFAVPAAITAFFCYCDRHFLHPQL
ncbi:MAG: hypothetical protein ACRC1H_05570 [Caldilineaceae bacterium]